VQEDSPIKSITDLKSKAVGVNAYDSYGQIAMVLKYHGQNPAKGI